MQRSIYPERLDEKTVEQISKGNYDSVFIDSNTISKDKIDLIRKKLPNTKIELVFKVFEGKDLLKKHPDAKPVELTGKETQLDDYYPVNPLHDGVRQSIIEKAEQLKDLNYDSVWLDHLHFPTLWNKPEPLILDTDYSDSSLSKFEDFIGEPIEGANLEEKFLHIDGSYYHEWLKFKSNAINSMAKELKSIFNKPTGFFAIPWQDDEYGAAIKRIMGQDLEELLKILDDIAVLMYRKDMGKESKWLSDTVDYFWQTGQHFLSVIQPTDTLEKDIELASSKPSRGILIKYGIYMLSVY